MRAGPDDLLLLAGYGFAADDRVVYQAIGDTTAALLAPSQIPARSTTDLGLAEIVSTAQVPLSLTVKLPPILRVDQSYALWVRTARGEWSRAVLINDARPLWISPAYIYATGSVASLPRELKIIGRNLQPSPGYSTQIRLTGPQSFHATAIIDERSSVTMNHYVARIRLPPSLAIGRYRIEVSRDGVSWVELSGQQMEVRADRTRMHQYSVGDPQFGGCRADDGADDTACIVRAIDAAQRAGGGVIYFPPGTWDLIDGIQPGLTGADGIVVPSGVQLRGAGVGLSRVIRHPQWSEHSLAAAFTVIGHTTISGFTFADLQTYQPRDRVGAFLQLGSKSQRDTAVAGPSDSVPRVDDVTISQNEFDRVYVAIGSGAVPIQRLFITYNTFGAYYSAIELGGNKFIMEYEYRIDDSVIDHNYFEPSSRLSLTDRTGTMASEIGAAYRMDFSGNTADGSSTRYLYAPDDPRGWRAAFFWNMNNNMEELLVSQNTATCTGDKIGDGEAISYDNNGNTFAVGVAAVVAESTSASVAVSVPIAARQNDRDVPLASYYVGHWIQIVSGPGLGQVRKIIAYTIDAASNLTTFRVAPDWDVVPVPGQTRLAIGREFWQTYTLDNTVDHRRPLCQKSNRSRHDGGVIAMYAQSADSVIEGNRQYDTDGILVEQNYIVPAQPCPECTMGSFIQSFLEVRANTIDGKYDWDTDCSVSGIVMSVAASASGDPTPPTMSYGVSISRNTIRHADAATGGAVALYSGWFAGPEPHRWPLIENMLIDHNVIRDIDGPPALAVCSSSRHPRVGIEFPAPQVVWNTVLYANSCSRVSVPINGDGVGSVRVCPSPIENSCECPP